MALTDLPIELLQQVLQFLKDRNFFDGIASSNWLIRKICLNGVLLKLSDNASEKFYNDVNFRNQLTYQKNKGGFKMCIELVLKKINEIIPDIDRVRDVDKLSFLLDEDAAEHFIKCNAAREIVLKCKNDYKWKFGAFVRLHEKYKSIISIKENMIDFTRVEALTEMAFSCYLDYPYSSEDEDENIGGNESQMHPPKLPKLPEIMNFPEVRDLYVTAYGLHIFSLPVVRELKNLQSLSLINITYFSDVSDLRDLPELRYLDLSGNTDLSNIRPIANLPKLKYLNILCTSVSKVSYLASLPRLKTILLDESSVKDINTLESIPGLKVIKYSDEGEILNSNS